MGRGHLRGLVAAVAATCLLFRVSEPVVAPAASGRSQGPLQGESRPQRRNVCFVSWAMEYHVLPRVSRAHENWLGQKKCYLAKKRPGHYAMLGPRLTVPAGGILVTRFQILSRSHNRSCTGVLFRSTERHGMLLHLR